jgi:hypothetical protein
MNLRLIKRLTNVVQDSGQQDVRECENNRYEYINKNNSSKEIIKEF